MLEDFPAQEPHVMKVTKSHLASRAADLYLVPPYAARLTETPRVVRLLDHNYGQQDQSCDEQLHHEHQPQAQPGLLLEVEQLLEQEQVLAHHHPAAFYNALELHAKTQRRDQPRTSAATGKHTDRRVRRLVEKTKTSLAEEEDSSALAAEDLPSRVEHYINTIVDPPVNPTTELPHVPGQDLSVSELRKDWPNTPLSNSGLVESVQQRIEWLAHRIPHGYQTPGQLAEWYTKGYFTRFESESEKEEVLKLAQEMARAEADKETEKTNVEVQPKDMEFDDVVTRAAERKGLADTYVRGVYPDVKKQKMPFLDQIVRNLNNNATFPHGKTEQFMQTVQKVIVSHAQDGGQAQKRTEK
ncbi:uncharacterized protein A1O5_09361 [Cladophialophora psammophila CBS 110553]|uniref:Uncharacterized protein n=1 Tax=Cladophialophora psammophila CBS 110553 TaxID=1182543 RepID=W9WHI6_9EURO|nr:uncharacterized protein A1O5_09361 [Cladophialophora psammophila CBS 110553]EXJ67348.1 hypothetical protein A1O5_09361 [Cladophialophora psammophila CBS 110553]